MGIDSFSNVNPYNFPLINANQKAAKSANQMDNNINNNNNKIQGPLLDPLGSTQIKRKRERESTDKPNANWTVPQIPQKQELKQKGNFVVNPWNVL